MKVIGECAEGAHLTHDLSTGLALDHAGDDRVLMAIQHATTLDDRIHDHLLTRKRVTATPEVQTTLLYVLLDVAAECDKMWYLIPGAGQSLPRDRESPGVPRPLAVTRRSRRTTARATSPLLA